MANLIESLALPEANRTAAVVASVKNLPADQLATLQKALANIPDPDQPTGNVLWKIVIWAFAIVMVGTALVLGLSVFFPGPGATKPDTILTVFTTVTAFFAGLLAPSPVGKKG